VDSAVLGIRVLLAAIFVVAAIGKLLDLPGSRRSLVGFGVPQRAASVLGTLLPFAELAAAVALVPAPTARWGAVGALGLLLTFVAGIANALRRGEAPDCNCFGAIHSAPASRTTLARNVALAAIAGVVVGWGSGPAIDTWLNARSAAELVAVGVGIAALALLAASVPLWLDKRRLSRDLEVAEDYLRTIPLGLRVGAPAPHFMVPDGEGGSTTLESLLARGRPIALVFLVAGCGPCEPLLPELRRLQSTVADELTIALLGVNTLNRYDDARARHAGELMLVDAIKEDPGLQDELDELFNVMRSYQAQDSPSAVLVTPAGTIGSAIVDGRPAIEALIRLTLSRATVARRPPLALDHGAALTR
jgi:uncharacterized membrane protein YphA (DoxX/SURF4 family)